VEGTLKSTTAIGDELRDHVIDLLEARGVSVEREIRIGTKKIDVLASIEDDFEDRDIAIECKNYDKNLGQDEVTKIYAEHLSLLQGSDIDGIWIIVRRDFSADAKNWANAQQGLTLFTLAQFEEKQFGFKRFVRQVAELFQDQRLDQYYIPQRLSQEELLIDRIKSWIEGDDARPVAILGGYSTRVNSPVLCHGCLCL
jgi:Restriction endonuclease